MTVESATAGIMRKQVEAALGYMAHRQYFAAAMILVGVAQELMKLHLQEHRCDDF